MHGTQSDLSDQPLKDADFTCYTDGSSYLLNGEKEGRGDDNGRTTLRSSGPVRSLEVPLLNMQNSSP